MYDPEGTRLPIKVDSSTNGETLPIPLKPRHVAALQAAHQAATEASRRLAMNRRNFLVSACGVASTLLAFNKANAALGVTGGFYDVPEAAGLDGELATAVFTKKHFIFDVQTHHFNPPSAWGRDEKWSKMVPIMGKNAGCLGSIQHDDSSYFSCFTSDRYLKDIFLDSDTDITVLSFVPSTAETMPLSMEGASMTREAAAALRRSHRVLLHGRIIPTLAEDLHGFQEQRERWNVVAAKTYTQFYDRARSYWLDDHRVMDPFVAMLQKSGIDKICIHKGQTFPAMIANPDSVDFASCRDVGPAARMYRNMKFIIYHSGYESDVIEMAFDPKSDRRGTDSLVRSLLRAGIGPGENVYAEIGATWRYLMKDPDQASHLLGKLFKYVGEDNILWGTDCVIFGSPQDQIQAFQSFQISTEFQDKYGYPAITDRIRAKIFGLNAARIYGISDQQFRKVIDKRPDAIEKARALYADQADPSFASYGPRNRAEFIELARLT